MKKLTRGVCLLLSFVFLLCAAGCAVPVEQPPADVDPIDELKLSKYTRDSYIMSVDGVELITGDNPYVVGADGNTFVYNSRNHKALKSDDVGGTDLGVPFYNSVTGEMYLLFGDTFGASNNGKNHSGNWRSSVMAISKDFDLSDGLTYDSWWRGGSDQAEAVIEGKHFPKAECIAKGLDSTKIPQGGIEINGTVYIFYESIRYFGVPGTWYVNYQGVIKSTDNCRTFERVHDLTWFNSVTNHFNYALFSAAESWEDATNKDVTSEGDITPEMLSEAREKIDNAEKREAPYFSQCYPVDGKDGYVYVFGRKNGRQHGIKVARVAYENIEDFDSYEYYCGNENGDPDKPIWKKGYEGLRAINNDTKGYVLATNEDEPSSNMSVMWNEYLGKWMLFYYRPQKNSADGGQYYPMSVGFRLSDTVWGNYGEYHKVLETDFFLPDGPEGEFQFIGYDYAEKGFAQTPDDDASSFKMNKTVTFYSGFVHEKYQELDGRVFYFVLTLADVYESVLMKVTLN
ncbi:MAG: DUF4185 domain-containing protein [Clostridia bacterium]|nr:DUF4185 domain-containing protein [Clostridia bacterium]